MSKYLKNIQVFSRRLFHSLKSRVVQRHTRVSHEHKVPRHGHPFVHVWVTTTRHSASIFFPSLLLPSPLLSLSLYISLFTLHNPTPKPLSPKYVSPFSFHSPFRILRYASPFALESLSPFYAFCF